MSEQWQYQLRVYLNDDMADVARSDRNNPALQPLTNILNKHYATLMSQFDAFENYVAEAEKEGPENFPLYKWTKATIEDPAKRAKHIKTFALHVSGNEVYANEVADALEADLQSLVGGALVTQIAPADAHDLELRWAGLQAHNRWLAAWRSIGDAMTMPCEVLGLGAFGSCTRAYARERA